jgi:prevent-host-death family protein
MKSSGLFDAKNRFSELCDSVATTSEPVTITRRGKPLVQIVPLRDESGQTSVWDSLEESREQHGPLTDTFELPARSVDANRPDPLTP